MNNAEAEFLVGEPLIMTEDPQGSRDPLLESHLRGLLLHLRGFAVYRLEYRPQEPETVRVVFASPSIAELLYPADPMDSTTWFENVHPEDMDTHRRNIRKKLSLNGNRTSLRNYLL
jgi:hypothetical protein